MEPYENCLQSIFSSSKIHWHRGRLEPYVEEFRALSSRNRLRDLHTVVPVTVELDLTNLCTHRCPSCAGRRTASCSNEQLFATAGDGETIPEARARRYIGEMADAGVKAVIFTGGGDPAVHQGLVALAVHACEVGLDVGLITNGELLHRHDLYRLVAACTWIRISVDAGHERDFLRIHGRGPDGWRQVWSNIRALAAARKNVNSSVTLGIGYLAGPKNAEGLASLAAMAHDSGFDYVQVRPFHGSPNFTLNGELAQLQRRYDSDTFKIVASAQKYTHVRERAIDPRNYSYCHIGQFASVICANEKMYLCCHSRNDARFCIGDLRRESFLDVVHGSRRAALIESVCVHDCLDLCRGDHVNRQVQGIIESGNAVPDPGPCLPMHVNFL